MAHQPLIDRGHIRLKTCRHGTMLYLASDVYIGGSLDRYGEFSEEEAALFGQLVQPGWVVVEVGANLGAHTVVLAKTVGPRGFVIAFEPQRVIFQILCANVAINALGNVYTHQAAVGREPGSITVPPLDYTEVRNYGGLPLGEWTEGESVPLLTIDSLNLPACHFLKIDVEGMEGDVIAGAEETIRRFKPMLYVENDRAEHSAALIGQLQALDYRLFWHTPPLFNPANFFGVAENTFGRAASINMLGFPASKNPKVEGLREVSGPDDRPPFVK